jgi:pimeloyl-ACP methyl ester carboxylesterase
MAGHPPIGELIDIGGYRLHLRRLGSGTPAAVMDSGLGGLSLLYELVLSRIAEFTTAVAYDRAGYAWSDPAPPDVPRASRQMMTELHILLEKAAIPPPYVLVGNSFGGINVMVYADLYPDETAGLVLIDPSTPGMFDIRGMPGPKMMELSARIMLPLARLGLLRWFVGPLFKPVVPGWKSLPKAVWDTNLALCAAPLFYDTWAREGAASRESFERAKQVGAALKNKPVLVLTGGEQWIEPRSPLLRPKAITQGILAQRDAIAALSSKGEHRIVEGASHTMQVDHPDAVVQAVREVVEAARRQ